MSFDNGSELNKIEWAISVRDEINNFIQGYKNTKDDIGESFRKFKKKRAYKKLCNKNGENFVLLNEFCITEQPYGLGCELTYINKLLKREKSAADLAADPDIEPLKPQGAQNGNKNASKNENKDSGTTFEDRGREYLLRRLKRDHPEIIEKLKNGEYKSVFEAAKKVGILKDRRISISSDPYKAVQAFCKKFDMNFLVAFASELNDELGISNKKAVDIVKSITGRNNDVFWNIYI